MSHKKIVIPLGPHHPLQEEPAFFELSVEGEKVTDIDITVGYVHRGIEKLSESKHFDQVPFLVERICGICSSSHPYAFVLAVEDMLGGEKNIVPERALYIRTIIEELQRIHSHLLWLGLAGHFLGYDTLWMWAWRYREPVLDCFEMITGNRQNYAIFKAGGVRHNIKDEYIPIIKKTIGDLTKVVDMFCGAITDDPVIKARLKGVGILTKQEAIEWCVVGPTARASGINIDVRRDDPYGAYDQINWNVIVKEEGSVFAKIQVRILELYESINIIRQCLEKMPEGEINTEIKDIPIGEGIGRVEAPRGECLHYIRSDGTNRPIRHKIRAPSYMNVPSNKTTVVGETICDAAIILAAVDPCYSCTDRTTVLDRITNKKVLNGWDLIELSRKKTEELRRNFKSILK